jgi:hypothetical protein
MARRHRKDRAVVKVREAARTTRPEGGGTWRSGGGRQGGRGSEADWVLLPVIRGAATAKVTQSQEGAEAEPVGEEPGAEDDAPEAPPKGP